MYLRKSLISVFMLILMLPAQAGVYKWVDENGKVHYGDKPTTDAANEVKVNKTKSTEGSRNSAERKNLQQRFLKAREDERNEKNKARAEAKQKRAETKLRCTQAKKEYDKYRYAGAIYDKGKDGERKYLSFKKREEYERSLSDAVQKWCRR